MCAKRLLLCFIFKQKKKCLQEFIPREYALENSLVLPNVLVLLLFNKFIFCYVIFALIVKKNGIF